MSTIAKTAPADGKSSVQCECGNPILPYVIGDHEFTATKCPTCLDLERKQEDKDK